MSVVAIGVPDTWHPTPGTWNLTPVLWPSMALALTPRLLRRGLELFALISLVGVVVVLLVYGDNLQAVVAPLLHLRWRWLLVRQLTIPGSMQREMRRHT